MNIEVVKEDAVAPSVLNDGLGWNVSHPKYGKWFISREAVIADWKQDHAKAYPDDPVREPTNEDVETWWSEQTLWIDCEHNWDEGIGYPGNATVGGATICSDKCRACGIRSWRRVDNGSRMIWGTSAWVSPNAKLTSGALDAPETE